MTKNKMLLHICCGPCATHVLKLLALEYNLTGLFFNPNIHPASEHLLRHTEVERLLKQLNIPLMPDSYQHERWLAAVKGVEREPEGDARCSACFRMRLDETARAAAVNEFEIFATTLTISPHKNASLINQIGRETGLKHKLSFHEADFKKGDGYAESCKLSRELGLYRQKYCGCEFSI